MMTQAFYTGISGVRSGQAAIDVTADNLANISTVGYRGYNVEFAALFGDMINTADSSTSVNSNVGIGTRIQATSANLNEGSLMITDRSTDLAIYGDGWFGIQSSGEPLYTRAGSFVFDVNNDLVTTEGFYVLGTVGENIEGDTLTSQVDEVILGDVGTQRKLRFPRELRYPAIPSTSANFYANLGVENIVQTVGAAVVDPEGIKNELKLTFTKSPVQTPPGSQWDVVATTQTLNGETIYDTQSGTITFDGTGALTESTLTTIDNNGAPVSINLGSGYAGIISIDAPNSSGSSTADGTISGDLLGYEINRNAEVIATFSNGKQSSVGKIALYHFQNDQGLTRIDGTTFQESSNSGRPIFYADENGKNILGAEVINFKLESSNVKIEVSLTELIIQQRVFDSNSKVITTADQMIQKALNMKK